MDAVVGRIADYAHALSYDALPAQAVQLCKRSIVDALGCALGAIDAQPSRIARALADQVSVENGARVLFSDHRTLPELATFANGVMIRYLDGNDAFQGGGGHPSDVLAAILAAAEASHADGKAIIAAVTLAYEVYCNLWKTARVRRIGIDHIFYTAVGSALGAAKVLGLNNSGITEALSLAITSNVALDATRYGVLGMWKGCAGANAARNGVFAALLAQHGMTGPEKPIEGGHGLQNLVGEFELLPFGGNGHPYGLSEVTLKYFLCEGHALSPITVALELASQVRLEEIKAVTVYTYYFAWEVIGTEPEKWRPETREAADHSMPYIVAAILAVGAFSDEIYSDERLRDPRIRALIDKIEIKEDPELTRQFPEKMPCRIEITTRNGERKIAATDYPRGHYNNPMTDEQVSAKFRGLAQRVMPSQRIEQALSVLWQLEAIANPDAIFSALKLPRL